MVQSSSFPITYRLSLFTCIAMFLLGGIAIAFSGFMIFLVGRESGAVGIGSVFGVIGAVLIANVLVAKVVLYQDRVSLVGLFGTKTLALSEIKGRRGRKVQGRTFVELYPIDEGKKRLSITNSYKLDDTFEDWISKIRDLDAEDEQAAEQEIAKDPRYGFTPEERKAKAAQLRRITAWSGFISMPLVAWVVFNPYPAWLAIAIRARDSNGHAAPSASHGNRCGAQADRERRRGHG